MRPALGSLGAHADAGYIREGIEEDDKVGAGLYFVRDRLQLVLYVPPKYKLPPPEMVLFKVDASSGTCMES